jgi:hypothetical protein
VAEAAMAAVVEARAEAHSSTIGSSSTPAATVLPNAFEADALEPAPGEAALCTMADVCASASKEAQLGSARLKRSE